MKDSRIEWIGEIPEDWEVGRLKDFFKVISGATPTSSNPNYWDGNIVWITPADYKTEDIYINKSKRMITKEGLDSCATTLVPINSVIVSNRAPIGQVALTGIQLCTNQGCKALINRTNIVENKFIYYYLSIVSKPLNILGKGTTFLELSAFDLSSFNIPITSLQEQQKIAIFLDQKVSQIDHIIEKTKESIEEYKKYKQSLITEAVTKGLNPNVEMKDSGIEWIGEIPKHWEVVKMRDLFKFGSGLTITKSDLIGVGIKVIYLAKPTHKMYVAD
jgi:type I restriction enzyme S subunit